MAVAPWQNNTQTNQAQAMAMLSGALAGLVAGPATPPGQQEESWNQEDNWNWTRVKYRSEKQREQRAERNEQRAQRYQEKEARTGRAPYPEWECAKCLKTNWESRPDCRGCKALKTEAGRPCDWANTARTETTYKAAGQAPAGSAQRPQTNMDVDTETGAGANTTDAENDDFGGMTREQLREAKTKAQSVLRSAQEAGLPASALKPIEVRIEAIQKRLDGSRTYGARLDSAGAKAQKAVKVRETAESYLASIYENLKAAEKQLEEAKHEETAAAQELEEIRAEEAQSRKEAVEESEKALGVVEALIEAVERLAELAPAGNEKIVAAARLAVRTHATSPSPAREVPPPTTPRTPGSPSTPVHKEEEATHGAQSSGRAEPEGSSERRSKIRRTMGEGENDEENSARSYIANFLDEHQEGADVDDANIEEAARKAVEHIQSEARKIKAKRDKRQDRQGPYDQPAM